VAPIIEINLMIV